MKCGISIHYMEDPLCGTMKSENASCLMNPFICPKLLKIMNSPKSFEKYFVSASYYTIPFRSYFK